MQEIFCDHLCLMTLKIWFYLFEIFYFLFSFFFWCLFYKWVIWNKSCWILDNKACFYFLCVHQTQLYIQSPLNFSAQDNTAVRKRALCTLEQWKWPPVLYRLYTSFSISFSFSADRWVSYVVSSQMLHYWWLLVRSVVTWCGPLPNFITFLIYTEEKTHVVTSLGLYDQLILIIK